MKTQAQRTAIMQKEGPMSPAFLLQWEPTSQDAKIRAFGLASKRDQTGKQWPVWSVNGMSY